MCPPSRSRLTCQCQPSSVAAQVLQQEAAHDRVGHRLAQRLLGLVAPLDGGEVERPHRLDVADELASARVGHRGDVDDDQALDELGVPQRQAHRDLAAHRVPDERHRPVRPELVGDEVGQLDVVEGLGPRRSAVVGHVEQQHPVVGAERLGDLGPVLALAEETVAEGDRRPVRRRARWCAGSPGHPPVRPSGGDDGALVGEVDEAVARGEGEGAVEAALLPPATADEVAEVVGRRSARAPRARGRSGPSRGRPAGRGGPSVDGLGGGIGLMVVSSRAGDVRVRRGRAGPRRSAAGRCPRATAPRP